MRLTRVVLEPTRNVFLVLQLEKLFDIIDITGSVTNLPFFLLWQKCIWQKTAIQKCDFLAIITLVFE